MIRRNVVHYVTRQYMKKNKKRTFHLFLGIACMVMLMTAVFVGKETAIGLLQNAAEEENGKWHVNMYDLTEDDYKNLSDISWVKSISRSENLGDLDLSAIDSNKKPYLNVKGYEPDEVDWMNLQLVEGRFPQNSQEIVLSQSIRDDGTKISVGDTIGGELFDRAIIGTGDMSIIFPFYSITVDPGETVSVPQNFPRYEENDSFKEVKNFIGESRTYTVVGFVEQPFFESTDSGIYTGITLFQGDAAHFNASLQLNLSHTPSNYHAVLRDLAGSRKIEFNDSLLIFTGNSSNGTLDLLVNAVMIFGLVFIAGASIILIYNVFNLSFRERSMYLGMLSSIGATGKQKRSSVYYEAGMLLLFALPVGILAGLFAVKIGIGGLMPYLMRFSGIVGISLSGQATSLKVTPESILFIVLVSVGTVFISASLPAHKVGKIGAVESIRGNLQSKEKQYRTKWKNSKKQNAEVFLAEKFIHRQNKRTAGIRRAVTVFLVLLLVTSAGTSMLVQVAEKKAQGDGAIGTVAMKQDESGFLYVRGTEEAEEEYQAIVSDLKDSTGVNWMEEWESVWQSLYVPSSVYSKSYWAAYQDVLRQYYSPHMTDEEFSKEYSKLTGNTPTMISLVAPPDDILEKIAEMAGTDMNAMMDSEKPGTILIQSGHVSTDNIKAGSGIPNHYRYYDMEKMSDLVTGDLIEAYYYTENGTRGDFPLTVQGYVTKEQMQDIYSTDARWLTVIVSQHTLEKLQGLMGYEAGSFSKELHLSLNSNGNTLLTQLKNLNEGSQNLYFIDAGSLANMMDFKNIAVGMLRILAGCFVVLVSLICLLNLYNSISGYMQGRRQEMAALISVGMTKKQLAQMVCLEGILLLGRSLLWSVLFSAILIYGIQKGIVLLFGGIQFQIPIVLEIVSVILTFGAVLFMMWYAFRKIRMTNILENIRQESI